MQNNISSKSVIIILFYLFFIQMIIGNVDAQDERQPIDVARQIDEFLMADEFKAEEREKLRSLPVESVDILTARLNTLNPGDMGELRVFEFLAVKVGQFKRSLSSEQKAAALSALEAKAKSQGTPYDTHRIQLLEKLKAEVSEDQKTRPSSSSDHIPGVRHSPDPMKTTDTGIPPNHRRPTWPWITAGVALVASLAYFLKRKLTP